MKTRFKNAIDKLVYAFFNDELRKGSCKACAVGNICDGKEDWMYVFMTGTCGMQEIKECNYKNYLVLGSLIYKPKIVIDETGYYWKELARVEKAFELNTKIRGSRYHNHTKQEIMQDQYNGLMAVVDVLCDIEGYNSKEYKKMFEYENVES